MEMIRYVLFLVLVTCMLVVSIIMLVQEIKAIKKIRVKSDDGNIEAIVVSHCFDVPRGFQPVVQYNVNGIEEKYIYHYCYYDEKEYPIGKKVNLKFSQESGLAYDKKDLIKAFLLNLLFTGILLVGVLAIFYNIFFFQR